MFKEIYAEVGDTIVSRGKAEEISEILTQDWYGEEDGLQIEFRNANGEYCEWKQGEDGGELIKAKKKSNEVLKEEKTMTDLIRANKITVKATENGYVADFYRTHKHIASVNSHETGWVAPEGVTKTGERESFRAYAVENANLYGINWMPEDMRSDNNRRKAKYETDEDIFNDAVAMVTPLMIEMVDKCKYGVEWGGIDLDEIKPMTHTAKGTALDQLGITDGKYNKSGNWAWATINLNATLKYKGEELYKAITMELVSGQMKKPKITITSFNEDMKTQIIEAGLATVEELDPPKEKKSKDKQDTAEPKVEETTKEEKPKRRGRKPKNEAKEA